MNEQDADRLRDAIARDQTLCRCGHLLACCADCVGWMQENSARIAEQWRARLLYFQIGSLFTYSKADAAEAYDIAYYKLQR